MPAYLSLFSFTIIFLFGIVIGSFLNVCIYRIPAAQSIIPESHCMRCGHKLHWYDLFPIFSYLFLKGRCRYCGGKISPQYPLIEFCNGVLYLIVFMANGWEYSSIIYCLMASVLLVIGVIDERTGEIPFLLNIWLGVLGIIMTILDYEHFVGHLIGLFCVSLPLYLLYVLSGGNAIGGGDIKLMAAAGLLLSWQKCLLAFFGACILGAVIHVIRMKFFHAGRSLALGPYLAAGIFLAALWGDPFLSWYMGMLLI